MPKSQETEAVAPQASPAEKLPTNRRRHEVNTVLGEIYREHFLKLVHRLRAWFGNGPPEPEDVAQRAFEQIANVDTLASITNIEAFLWRVAKNVRISELRSTIASQARSAEYSALFFANDGYHFATERVFLAKEDVKTAMKVIEAMPETRRRAFVLVRLQGLSHQEAAVQLGISRPAISKHIARASLDLHNAVSEVQ